MWIGFVINVVLIMVKKKMKKCPECGRFIEKDDMELEPPYYHFICNKCDMFYCFEDGCHCCDE